MSLVLDRPAASAAGRARRLDIDRAKGIAILLVVIGHLVARAAPPGAEWYEPLRYALYRFHMPFFLYLSGTVAALSGLLATPAPAIPALLRRRAVRLLLPFLGIGLLILGAKLVAMQLVVVDNAPAGLATGLRDLFWTTADSPATSVWYLWVLFLATVAALVLRRLGSTGLVLLGLALQCVELPPLLYLDRFGRHALFFAVGLWVAERQGRLLPIFDQRQGLWWALFGASLAVAMTAWLPEGAPRLPEQAALVLCGLLSIPALHGLVRRAPVATWDWPLALGAYAMAIYLFNTLAIGGAKAALIVAGIGYTAGWFTLHLAVALAAGIAVPILLKRFVLRRIPALDRLTS